MKKLIPRLCMPLAVMMLLTACSHAPSFDNKTGISLSVEENEKSKLSAAGTAVEPSNAAASDRDELSLPGSIMESYYDGQSDPAFEYFKKKRIQRFLAMWVEEETGNQVYG